jgi:hypothetical protein
VSTTLLERLKAELGWWSAPSKPTLPHAELEQDDDQSEISQQMPSVSRRREPVGHRHRHGDEAVLVDEEMRDADVLPLPKILMHPYCTQMPARAERGDGVRSQEKPCFAGIS